MQSIVRRLLPLGMLPLTLLITSPGAPAPAASLDTTTWVLHRYGERGSLAPVLPGTEVTLIVDRQQGRLAGNAGCNSYFAGIRVDGARLAVSDVGATKKFCGQPDGVMHQETRYLETLRTAERYRIRGNRLRIIAARDHLLVFRAAGRE
jgi:heat shock protein HslJ